MIRMVLRTVMNETWPILTVFLTTIIVVRFFYLRSHKEKFVLYKECMFIFSIIYIWLLFELLTTTEINTNSSVNLIPFEEILRYDIGSKMFMFNVLGNILIFIPFGYLLSFYIKPKNTWPTIIVSLITSTIVEFTQLNIGRSFDIDDIILNIVGSFIGYLIYVIVRDLQKHLPDFFKSSLFYNIIWIILIIVLGIYLLSYWKVIF